MSTAFDLAATPLEPGITLIEASAGTGKTFAIAGIFLRLIIEQSRPIKKLLVVTFTEAATEELRRRVRQRLRDAMECLQGVATKGDDIVDAFRGDREKAMHDLKLALLSFDEAQIFTIHGFCQRVLCEHAFESGLPFDTELMTDHQPLQEEVARDFLRRQLYTAHPLVPRLALVLGKSPAHAQGLLAQTTNHHDVLLEPPKPELGCWELAVAMQAKLEEIAALWQQQSAHVLSLLSDKKNISQDKRKGGGEEARAEICAGLDGLQDRLGELRAETIAAVRKLRHSQIVKNTQTKGQTPQHALFHLAEEFCLMLSDFSLRFDHECLEFMRCELGPRKAARNVMGFDDLLSRLHGALKGPRGAALASVLAARYDVALIDEFQDTDALQYAIFQSIFTGAEHQLFFIGDPKQAIYSFRGADVDTYLAAAKAAQRRFHLGTNYRSAPRFIAAMNTLFSNAGSEAAFLRDGIGYHAVHAPKESKKSWEEMVPRPTAPMRWRVVADDEEAKRSINKEASSAQIYGAVAADIIRLLQSGATLKKESGSRPLALRDMAVLVRTNRQGRKLQARLRERGIHSTLRSGESVFAGGEAVELTRFLAAMLQPGRDSLLNAALASPLVGLDAGELLALTDEERQRWFEKFVAHRERWERESFIAMFRAALVEHQVRERMVARPGGERALTNFLHLSELLHKAETEHRLKPESLPGWLREQRNVKPGDAAELRLETDGDAVQIVTIHKSKGLEYAVVFCPFLWEVPDSNKKRPLKPWRDSDGRLRLDLRPRVEASPEAEAAHVRATQEEALRVAYVAITRGAHLCHIYAAETPQAEGSPLAHWLGGYQRAEIRALVEKAGGTMECSVIDVAADDAVRRQRETVALPSLAAQPFTAEIAPAAMSASFTALTSGHAGEAPDHDAPLPLSGEPAEEAGGIYRFEKGTRAGLFFHDVLEHLDFQKPEMLEPLVGAKLALHGLAGTPHRAALVAQLRRLLDVKLPFGCRLADILARERLNEVEFTHRLHLGSASRLRALFEQHSPLEEVPARLGRLEFRPVDGFLRGFMDMLVRWDGRFWLVDWKSNWLGDCAEDYDAAGLRAGMLAHHYHLQYHLYTLATDLYLAQRVPGYDYERHFGGVAYIFLRGIDPKRPQRGVYFDRPPLALVQAMRGVLQP